jgi:rhodanese-related sulfurtransferase
MISQIHPQQLADKLKSGEPVYLLDVRQPEEHAIAALPGSTLIPLGDLPARFAEIQPPPGALVVVYCHHGVRSLRGAGFLLQNGISSVASLAGGIDAWSGLIDPSVPRY